MTPAPQLRVLVTEPVLARFASVLTREGASTHTWDLCFDGSRTPEQLAVTFDKAWTVIDPADLVAPLGQAGHHHLAFAPQPHADRGAHQRT